MKIRARSSRYELAQSYESSNPVIAGDGKAGANEESKCHLVIMGSYMQTDPQFCGTQRRVKRRFSLPFQRRLDLICSLDAPIIWTS